MMDKRRLFWIVFLGAAAVLAVIPEFWPSPETAAVAPVARPAPPPRPAVQLAQAPAGDAPAAGSPLAALRGDPATAPVAAPAPVAASESAAGKPEAAAAEAKPAVDLFAAKTWFVPPPPPSAPPLPFKYMGKLDDSATLKAFLHRGEQVFVVTVGETIENTYRVESIKAGQMTLIYLPLNIPQTLSVGSPL